MKRTIQVRIISSSRLLSLDNGHVTFRWRDSRHGNQTKSMTLEAVEFIRRFLLHILPSGFVKIRHFGFLANRNRASALALCRQRLNASAPAADGPATILRLASNNLLSKVVAPSVTLECFELSSGSRPIRSSAANKFTPRSERI